MAKDVVPTCRYGHGQLIRCQLEKENAESGIYFVPTEHGLADMSQGFLFEIWKCQRCSYLELHDHGDE
jgi:hypothetical protein